MRTISRSFVNLLDSYNSWVDSQYIYCSSGLITAHCFSVSAGRLYICCCIDGTVSFPQNDVACWPALHLELIDFHWDINPFHFLNLFPNHSTAVKSIAFVAWSFLSLYVAMCIEVPRFLLAIFSGAHSVYQFPSLSLWFPSACFEKFDQFPFGLAFAWPFLVVAALLV